MTSDVFYTVLLHRHVIHSTCQLIIYDLPFAHKFTTNPKGSLGMPAPRAIKCLTLVQLNLLRPLTLLLRSAVNADVAEVVRIMVK